MLKVKSNHNESKLLARDWGSVWFEGGGSRNVSPGLLTCAFFLFHNISTLTPGPWLNCRCDCVLLTLELMP